MSDEGLTRRDVLVRGAGAVVAAGVAATGAYVLYDPTGQAGLGEPLRAQSPPPNFFADVDFPASSPRISVAVGDENQIGRMVRAAVEGLAPDMGMRRFIAPGDVVLLKPNVGFDRPPHLGATTHPEVLRSVIRLCREAGAQRVIVTDYPIEAPEVCFARSGIADVANAEGARLLIPEAKDFERVAFRSGAPDPAKAEVLGCWPVLYRPLAEATKLIGIAPVKDHSLSGASITMKNWYGLLGGRRNQFHQAIHAIISDLATVISPTLVIADATRVMLRNGPTGGRISDVRPGGVTGRAAVVASVDPVACDAWCFEQLLGRDPSECAYLELAQRKIGERIVRGERRFAERDWRAYVRQGLMATVSL